MRSHASHPSFAGVLSRHNPLLSNSPIKASDRGYRSCQSLFATLAVNGRYHHSYTHETMKSCFRVLASVIASADA
ncbi:MAG: hypothetical protein KIG55_08120 [Myroides sp.]|nr:hypothetical protein [Myroides sp.]